MVEIQHFHIYVKQVLVIEYIDHVVLRVKNCADGILKSILTQMKLFYHAISI